jgi:hypothetical protein
LARIGVADIFRLPLFQLHPQACLTGSSTNMVQPSGAIQASTSLTCPGKLGTPEYRERKSIVSPGKSA